MECEILVSQKGAFVFYPETLRPLGAQSQTR